MKNNKGKSVVGVAERRDLKKLDAGIEALARKHSPSPIANSQGESEALIVSRDSIRVKEQVRKHFSEESLKELADSIRKQGIVQRLIVRPLPKFELVEPDMVTKSYRIVKRDHDAHVVVEEWFPGEVGEVFAKASAENWMEDNAQFKYELVCGERRWRAAGLAGLSSVPVEVKVLDDEAALEIQLVENVQREDLSALEEAQAYARMRDELGYTVPDISEKTGKKRSTVFARLALLKLSPKVQEAMRRGKIPHTIAELIGRLPGEELQVQALANFTAAWREDDCISFRGAKRYMEENFQVNLLEASFDRHSKYEVTLEGVVTKCGSCVACPKRSANCKDEFPDIESPDVCTDPPCFKAKTEAHAAKVLRDALAGGATELSEEQLEDVFEWGTEINEFGNWVKASDVCEDDKEQRSFDALIGEKGPQVYVTKVKDEVVHLYKKEDVKPILLKRHGIKFQDGELGIGGGSDHDKQRAEREAKKAAKALVADKALRELRATISGARGVDLDFLQWVALEVAGSSYAYGRRHGITEQGDEGRKQLQERFAVMAPGDLKAAIVEALACDSLVSYEGEFGEQFAKTCAGFGVDLVAIEEGMKPGKEISREKTQKKQKGKGSNGKNGSDTGKVYLVNSADVIVNPEELVIPMGEKSKGKTAAKITYGYAKGGWRFGFDFRNGTSGHSSPCSCVDELDGYAAALGAVGGGIDAAMKFFIDVPKAHAAVTKFDQEFDIETLPSSATWAMEGAEAEEEPAPRGLNGKGVRR